MLKDRTEIGHTVRDVVEPGSATREETCHGAGIGSRLDEFNGSDEGNVDVVLGEFFNRGTCRPRNGFEDRRGLLNGRNCDADVVERKTVHG
jgi:hypothetical protein